MARVDFRQLAKFAEKLNKLDEQQIKQFNEATIKELAARLLRKVVLRTPVGNYESTAVSFNTSDGAEVNFTASSNKTGGTLKRGWTIGEVTRTANGYTIEVINPVHYASYVEFGHRTRNHTGWVEGRFMMTISEQELERDAPQLIENKLNRFLGEIFNA